MIYRIGGVVLCLSYFVLVAIFANSETIQANAFCEIFLPFVLAFCLLGGIVFIVIGFKNDKKSKQFEVTSEIAQGILKRTEKVKNIALVVMGIGMILFLLGFIDEIIMKVGAIVLLIGVWIRIFAKENKRYKEALNYLKTHVVRSKKSKDISDIIKNDIFVMIEHWDYLITKENDSLLQIWHNVTPQDGGYGTPVKFHITRDYFKDHTVKDLYDSICKMHLSPSIYIDRESELQQLEDALIYFDFLPIKTE